MMIKSISRGVWNYAILLIILIMIASVAAWQAISYIDSQIPLENAHSGAAAALIWCLTLGFMFLTGAFGLWAIHFSAEAESRRRIGRLVDAMDYIRDGLLVVDNKGQVTGSNPAIRDLVQNHVRDDDSLRNVFQCLSEEDAKHLFQASEPVEIESKVMTDGHERVLRFRSQPGEGLALIFISDVTAMNAKRAQSRHLARLQLIGQIARGVAHDFTNVLSVISGHASLLPHLKADSPEMKLSIQTINRSAENGSLLASHLLELTHPTRLIGHPTNSIGEHIASAADLLRYSLSSEWKVLTESEDTYPTIPLSGMQVEQIVLNLGLQLADIVKHPSTLRIKAAKPGYSTDILLQVPKKYTAVILIDTGATESRPTDSHALPETYTKEAGVIQSVVQSLLEEIGGSLDCLTRPDGLPIYRICLPSCNFSVISKMDKEIEGAGPEIAEYVHNWSILTAGPATERGDLDHLLKRLNIRHQHFTDVVDVLAQIEKQSSLDAMILDKYVLRQECTGLLKAILKLCPGAATVVLCDNPEEEPEALTRDIVFLPMQTTSSRVILALLEAKAMAAKRIAE